MRLITGMCAIALCLLLAHCQGEQPEGLAPGEEDLLVETTALLSLATQQLAGDSESLSARQDSIFSSLGLNRDDYHRLIEKVSRTPERWMPVWERIAQRIEGMAEDRPDQSAGQ